MSHDQLRAQFSARRRHPSRIQTSRKIPPWWRSLVTAAVLLFAALAALAIPLLAHADSASHRSKTTNEASAGRTLGKARSERLGVKQVGMASYYARKFAGRRMADGTPMRPESDNAASRTLPFGTKARVTNLRNGRTAVVTIRDRGPYARGRIIDVSPRTAMQLGIIKAGVARVEVMPLAIAQPGGSPRSVVALSGSENKDIGHEPL